MKTFRTFILLAFLLCLVTAITPVTAQDTQNWHIVANKSLMSDKPLPPTFLNVMWFQVFKTISERHKNYFPADFDFYKDKEYFFYETKVNPLKTFVAKLMVRLFLRGYDKKFDTK